MLLSFTVRGYRSFHQEQALSLVANNRYTDHADHLRAPPGAEERLLPVIALYGANGAGKSNLIKALAHLRALVVGKARPQLVPFMFQGGLEVSLEVQFTAQGSIFLYGISGTSERLREEWLYLRQGSRWVAVLEREEGKVEFGEACPAPSERLRALRTLGAKPHQTFLSFVREELDGADSGSQMQAVLDWFRRLKIILPSTMHTLLPLALTDDPDLRGRMGEVLSRVATGVSRLEVAERELDAAEIEALRVPWERLTTEDAADLVLSRNGRVYRAIGGQGRVVESSLHLHHPFGEGSIPFTPDDESDGTCRLLHLLPALLPEPGDGAGGAVIVVDEIDRSLHPQLSKHLLRRFIADGGNRQLIFTTHDLNLLDLDVLRRDEIWFVEKREGASDLYSLADFKIRKDLSIDRAYLQGRFGAVPPVEQEWPEWVKAIHRELEPRR